MRRHVRSCVAHSDWVKGCAPCNDRARLYEKRRAVARMRGERWSVPAEVTADRLRQLRAYGYGYRELAVRSAAHDPGGSGIAQAPIRRLCDGQVGWVQLRTFWVVERMYQDLRLFPGPDKRAALWAARKGWTPPPPLPLPAVLDEDDVDPIAVERAIGGDSSVCLTRAEKVAAWDALGARGVTDAERERVLRMGRHSVERWRGGYTRKKRIA